MRLCLLDETLDFPDVSTALDEPEGLLAFGGDLSVKRLVVAYRQGIFPWYNEGEPILWWSPNPRSVLIPQALHLSKSSQKHFRKCGWKFSINGCFSDVMNACASQREEGTWISNEMIHAFCELHEQGYAHSIEIWHKDELIGGLYGVKMGSVFFGESMFSRASNASKAALFVLSQHCINHDVELIDCQVESEHLESLGAQAMPRDVFSQRLTELASKPSASAWHCGTTPLTNFLKP